MSSSSSKPYLVFARKWRPLTFDQVVGQEHITLTLQKAIEKNRIAHAYLFCGTRGVGKTTVARIFARCLNCVNGPTPNPCGVCDFCTNILKGISFDVLEIDGASNNKVDDIRELRENVHYSAMAGKYRIIIIDEVHMLSIAAFNALLKTLEEPPPNVIFIFATTEPQKIPETIHSRCQRYDFRPISAEQIMKRLEYICSQEQISFQSNALMLIARKAEGSMRDSLSLLDQVYSFCKDTISEKDVRVVLGIVEEDIYREVCLAIAKKNPQKALEIVDNVICRGYDLNEFVYGFQQYLRDLLLARISGVLDNPRLKIQTENKDILIQDAALFNERTLLRMAEIVRKTENELRFSIFPRFLVEITLLKLVFIEDTVSIEELLRYISSAEAAEKAADSTTATIGSDKKKTEFFVEHKDFSSSQVQSPSSIQNVISVNEKQSKESILPNVTDESNVLPSESTADETSTDLALLWPKFIQHLIHERPNIGSFLSLGTVSYLTANSIDIRFSYPFRYQFSEVNKKNIKSEIIRRFNEFAGVKVELHFTLEPQKETQDKKNEPSVADARRSIDDDIEQEPIISSILNIFDAEVL